MVLTLISCFFFQRLRFWGMWQKCRRYSFHIDTIPDVTCWFTLGVQVKLLVLIGRRRRRNRRQNIFSWVVRDICATSILEFKTNVNKKSKCNFLQIFIFFILQLHEHLKLLLWRCEHCLSFPFHISIFLSDSFVVGTLHFVLSWLWSTYCSPLIFVCIILCGVYECSAKTVWQA